MPRKKTVDAPVPAPVAAPVAVPTLTAVPRKRITKTAAKPAAAPYTPSFDEIAEAAYLRFLSRGAGHGSDFDDWVEAERELAAKPGYAKAG